MWLCGDVVGIGGGVEGIGDGDDMGMGMRHEV